MTIIDIVSIETAEKRNSKAAAAYDKKNARLAAFDRRIEELRQKKADYEHKTRKLYAYEVSADFIAEAKKFGATKIGTLNDCTGAVLANGKWGQVCYPCTETGDADTAHAYFKPIEEE